MVRIISAFLMLTSFLPASGQTAHLKRDSTVYIQSKNGYEMYLIAAFDKKQVPLIVVSDPHKAEYIIQSTLHHETPIQPSAVIDNSSSATINEGNSASASFNSGFEEGQEAAERRAERKAALGYFSASITIANINTGQIVFAFSSTKDGEKQVQKTAEDFAGHLKKFIEKSGKQRK